MHRLVRLTRPGASRSFASLAVHSPSPAGFNVNSPGSRVPSEPGGTNSAATTTQTGLKAMGFFWLNGSTHSGSIPI